MPPNSISVRGYQRPFLKWAGNKYRLLTRIISVLPPGKRLIEPFAGSAALFLNAEYERYWVNDINPDLIALYQILQKEGKEFIHYAGCLFTPHNNTPKAYYRLRARFNTTADVAEKAALFVYLNRHGYNGLCRYSGSGIFNVPFGRYQRPYFPSKEMMAFHIKARRARFTCLDFRKVLARIRRGTIVYADPPYTPLSQTACFTHYSGNGFGPEEQKALTQSAQRLAKRGIPVLISNHDTPSVRQAYRNAQLTGFSVTRLISCKGTQRTPANEVLALFI
ncbi:Dam family site-specific DNA-(adenine-N6)-methyltransferase [Nitrosococcus oceani]|uniref:site-specific DNA-methyltransferase (adenine-specific) n=2 Tax=Nitrosococcus oceani TaxID=1229 RepID=Q3JE76_NITOC|nr:Dam family site-specific DNA-(adenine-N6)-methyltransferase [Nitrosococcus oceani]ABA56870.1 DNA adenine methylase Dam [Nitrosococcus oceani ATCC 19707]KFI20653.1 DNA adenine methylase [Nitrosococcus oceani C-27]KFI23745.1 DNA adenine methylase [Nitrosococcus oceani]